MNPTKYFLGIEEEKLLGHIISTYGVKVDPKRIEGIKNISFPKKVKSLQLFNGRIKFKRIFIPNLAELMNPTQKLLKKYVKFECTDEG